MRTDGKILRANNLKDVPKADDLTLRAARLLQQQGRVSQGVVVHLHKCLPMGGCLGGGSSDAATVLVALNHLWQVGLSFDELAALGLQLGADVPVFMHGQSAWAEGVGEQLTPITLDEPWFVVLVPQVHISTPEVFSDPELTRNSVPITMAHFLDGAGGNDCEAVVCRRYPPVAEALDWLSQFAVAQMTGTGACVFAAFSSQVEAEQVVRQLPDQGLQGFIAQSCNRSPLLDRLDREIVLA